MAVAVTLSREEMTIAAWVGAQRTINARTNGLRHAYGATDRDAFELSIVGACGEIAVAKFLGRYWAGITDFAGDVRDVEVRTRRSHAYDLMLHPGDHDHLPYVLVTGNAPALVLRGWILARYGKNTKWWSDPAGGRPAYFVPQHELCAIETLQEFLGRQREVW